MFRKRIGQISMCELQPWTTSYLSGQLHGQDVVHTTCTCSSQSKLSNSDLFYARSAAANTLRCAKERCDHNMLRYRTKYRYQPLDETGQQIRLLRLRPELSENGLIQCDISTHDLAEAPKYQALSYEWGRPKQLRCIGIAGGLFLVRNNLWLFLKMFRSEAANNTLLWIDQVCIDQQNIAERGHQVKLMGEIYTKAVRAVVWLGPSTGVYTNLQTSFDRHENLEFMDFGREGNPEFCTDGRCALCHWVLKNETSRKIAKTKIRKPKPMLKGLYDLTYWTRLWVVQENVLARDAIFFCGRFHYYRLDIYQYALLHMRIHPPGGRSIIFEHIVLLTDPDQFGTKLSLDEAFSRYMVAELAHSDSRDLVYGLLGLIQPAYRISVDYQSTSMEVFGRLMDAIMLSPTLEKTQIDCGGWFDINLGLIARRLGLTPHWESWLGTAEYIDIVNSPTKDFVSCLSLLTILGLQRRRWTPYELGSIVQTARKIQHTLLPTLTHDLEEHDKESLDLAMTACTRFVCSMNEIATAALPCLLLDIEHAACVRDRERRLSNWCELFVHARAVEVQQKDPGPIE